MVTRQDVERVAELANLELTEAEKAGMLRDLNAVLEHFAQLNELDLTAVPPMTQVSSLWTEAEALAESHPLRIDEVRASLSRDQALAQAPDSDGVFFRIPKVIER